MYFESESLMYFKLVKYLDSGLEVRVQIVLHDLCLADFGPLGRTTLLKVDYDLGIGLA